MRKSFLTKEYSIEPLNGTFNMKEQRAFFSSKILEIEDEMYVDNNNINWTESSDKTQGIRLEDINQSFNTELVKSTNHSLRFFPNQTEQQKKEFTRWEFKFNVREIITQYLFAQLKTNRTFEGIDNNKTLKNNIDTAINTYIKDNVYPRIKFFNIVLYVQYYKIGDEQGFLDENNNEVIALQYDNKFREDLITPSPESGETSTDYQIRLRNYRDSIKVKNFQLSIDPNQEVATVIYKQTESSLNFKFDYYYDVIWVKA
jgi:hypothetical protein